MPSSTTDRKAAGCLRLSKPDSNLEGGGYLILLGRVCKTEPILEAITTARLVYLEATEVTRRQRYAHGQVLDVVKRSTTFDDAMRREARSARPKLSQPPLEESQEQSTQEEV